MTEENENAPVEQDKDDFTKDDVDSDVVDDDLEVLASNDEVVASADAMSALAQGEDFMVWNIEGLYDDDTGRVFKSRQLKQNPPILHIENMRDGETYFANFVLTRDFAKTLEAGLRTTTRAYSGVTDSKPFTKEGMKMRVEELIEWVKAHPFGVSVIGLVLVFIIVFGFIL